MHISLVRVLFPASKSVQEMRKHRGRRAKTPEEMKRRAQREEQWKRGSAEQRQLPTTSEAFNAFYRVRARRIAVRDLQRERNRCRSWTDACLIVCGAHVCLFVCL
jgi:hypothetical protein